jgi:hypothetical protein
MKYFKVNVNSNNIRVNNKILLVADELYTPNEIVKLNLSASFVAQNFTDIKLNRLKSYWFFGARFNNSIN